MATPEDRYPIEQMRNFRASAGKRYQEFLRIPAMSAGLYALAAGDEDKQSPHHEDELYYVVRGRAKFRIGEEGGEWWTWRRGIRCLWRLRSAHKFFDITEDLELLVFFALAETE